MKTTKDMNRLIIEKIKDSDFTFISVTLNSLIIYIANRPIVGIKSKDDNNIKNKKKNCINPSIKYIVY